LPGLDGTTLTGTDPSGLLEGRLEMVRQGDQITGRFELTLQPLAGCYPHEVLPAVRVLAACHAGDSLHFRRGPLTVASSSANAAAPDGLPDLYRLVAALEVLQDHLGALVPVPVEVEAGDFQDLMAMALALSGRRARLRFTGFSMPVRPGQIRSLLESVPDGPGAVYGAPNNMDITLDGHQYRVPGLALWAPKVLLSNRVELEAVADDETAEMAAVFSSPDDTGIFLIRAVDDPGPNFRHVFDRT
jgi:hypothetical protein